MNSIIVKLNSIFPKKIILRLFFLYIFLLVLTLFEFIGIGSIPILISMILDQKTETNLFGFDFKSLIKENSFFDSSIIVLGSIIILIFAIKAIFLLFFNYFELSLKKKMKLIVSEELILSYLKKPFIFFINNNSSKLTKNIITEVDHSVNFVAALIHISREVSVVFALLFVMMFFEPVLALTVFVIILILVTTFLMSTDSKLKIIAKKRWIIYGEVFKSVGTIFGGIKDIKIFKKEQPFIKRFLNSKKDYEEVMQISEFIRRLPKIILELISIIFLIGLTIIFLKGDKNILNLIPLLSLIAVVVIRFLPSFNTIAAELTHIKVYKLAFENVTQEIINIKNSSNGATRNIDYFNDETNAVKLRDLNFNYISEEKIIPSLRNFNIEVKKNSMTGIIGKSGAGKSTLINIILGLLTPQSGSVQLQKYKNSNKDLQSISYVPQDIFLVDDTLKNNIAFGLDNNEIDENKVMLCIQEAGLTDFLEIHKEGLNMMIGEKGIKLSGGERQRLGIARALYVRPEILILDEATSSLDNETEKKVMKTIQNLKSKCTIIIIAHRLSTIENCDDVFLINKGKLIDSGKLKELKEKYPNIGQGS